MSYVCNDPDSYLNKVIGDGQCVAFVRTAAGAPETLAWTEGKKITKGDPPLPKGTAIATFVKGKYPSNSTGNHAAIYISHDDVGLQVYDQWASKDKDTGAIKYQPVHLRTIRFHAAPHSSLSNNGNAFSIIN